MLRKSLTSYEELISLIEDPEQKQLEYEKKIDKILFAGLSFLIVTGISLITMMNLNKF